MPLWKDRISELIREMPTATEDQIGLADRRGDVDQGGRAAQADLRSREGPERPACRCRPTRACYRNADAIVEQAVRFAALGPEHDREDSRDGRRRRRHRRGDLSRRQHQRDGLVLAAAGDRGGRGGRAWTLRGARRKGKDTPELGSVCTLMVGRLDDWLKLVADKRDISVDPGVLEWAGVAVFKKAYAIYKERGYRTAAPVGRLPQSHALERVHRRRRRDFAAAQVAGALQRERH